MELYLIRHGKTDAFLENRRQSPTTPLGELGRKQVAALAERLSLSKIDHLYSSDWPRAYQTAEILSAKTGLPIKVHPLVHEMIKTSLLYDLPDNHEITQRYLRAIEENGDNYDWRFNVEGESLNDLIKRAGEVIEFLVREHPDEVVAVVTHGTFTMALVSLMLLGFDYDKESFKKLFMSLKIHNTGVSTFEYNPIEKRWRMLCFNDHGHLENEM